VDTRGYFLEVKRPGHEADHSPPPKIEVRKVWSYVCVFLYIFMARRVIKDRVNIVFAFTVQ
jgi:hypothetical protein